MIEIRHDNRRVLEPLFAGKPYGMSLVKTYFDGYNGTAWADDAENPKVCLLRVGEFGFPAGDAASPGARELLEKLTELARFWLVYPPDEAWDALIREVWGERAVRAERYAIRHDTVFNREALAQYAQAVPEGVTLVPMNRALFEICRHDPELWDFVSNFRDWEHYDSYAKGILAIQNNEILGGCSTYTRFDDVSGYRYAQELEVDVREQYRRRGLAKACAARMILDCLADGIYPAWDAASRISVDLAEKFGYRESHGYFVYILSR